MEYFCSGHGGWLAAARSGVVRDIRVGDEPILLRLSDIDMPVECNKIRIVFDQENTIKEKNEDNNIAEIDIPAQIIQRTPEVNTMH